MLARIIFYFLMVLAFYFYCRTDDSQLQKKNTRYLDNLRQLAPNENLIKGSPSAQDSNRVMIDYTKVSYQP